MGNLSARLVIAGLSGDCGKTLVSLSLAAALTRRGLMVAPFKKGPDYIDSAWLSLAAGRACRNLDTFLVDRTTVLRRFTGTSGGADLALIEGNRGLFDGKDVAGSHSTAALAERLCAPLILVVNATKTTRTIAALVHGCQTFEPGINIAGVVLNRIAGARHRRTVTEAVEKYCRIPVVGVIPKLDSKETSLPGRHLGLVPPSELEGSADILRRLADLGEKHLDLDAILSIARSAKPLQQISISEPVKTARSVKIGYFADSVFTFYYPENLEALRAEGAELIPVSSLADPQLPDVDGLYIGGGFPETQAGQLAGNRSLMASVRQASLDGLPVYAECGGLIYLSRSLRWKDQVYPMAAVFPIDLEMTDRPVGHGYTEMEADGNSPFYRRGQIIRGHEFHYSRVVEPLGEQAGSLRVATGVGLGNGRDGLVAGNTMACYTHIHADGVPEWGSTFAALAAEYEAKKGR